MSCDGACWISTDGSRTQYSVTQQVNKSENNKISHKITNRIQSGSKTGRFAGSTTRSPRITNWVAVLSIFKQSATTPEQNSAHPVRFSSDCSGKPWETTSWTWRRWAHVLQQKKNILRNLKCFAGHNSGIVTNMTE